MQHRSGSPERRSRSKARINLKEKKSRKKKKRKEHTIVEIDDEHLMQLTTTARTRRTRRNKIKSDGDLQKHTPVPSRTWLWYFLVFLATIAFVIPFTYYLWPLIYNAHEEVPLPAPPETEEKKEVVPEGRGAPRGHSHQGEFMFNLKGEKNKFHRYPHDGGIESIKGFLPSALECCCRISVERGFIIACNQGFGMDNAYGIEALMRQSRTSDGKLMTYLAVRHQTDAMKGALCRASWH